jgi:predicted TIM-barrel fold metal-dependent hydrolase
MLDAHLHIGHSGRTLEDTLAHSDGLGAAQAVLLALEDHDVSGGPPFCTDDVLRAKQQYPNRVLPCCHVDLRREDALRRIEGYAARGCVGFGEQKQRLPLNDRRIEQMLALCNELAWPVTFHFQEGPGGFNTGLPYLETLLQRFPGVKFIGHAQSWWANLSGVVPPPEETLYPAGPVAPGGLAVRLLADYSNMFADLSAGSGYGALSRDEGFAREFLARFQHKLLFASDCPCRDGQGTGYEPGCSGRKLLVLLDRLLPDAEMRENVLQRNAARLFTGNSATA